MKPLRNKDYKKFLEYLNYEDIEIYEYDMEEEKFVASTDENEIPKPKLNGTISVYVKIGGILNELLVNENSCILSCISSNKTRLLGNIAFDRDFTKDFKRYFNLDYTSPYTPLNF